MSFSVKKIQGGNGEEEEVHTHTHTHRRARAHTHTENVLVFAFPLADKKLLKVSRVFDRKEKKCPKFIHKYEPKERKEEKTV